VGEGEETVVDLTRALSRPGATGPDLAAVRGIGFKRDGRPILTEPRPFIKNLDAYSPAWHLLDISQYIYQQRHCYTDIGSRISGDRVFALITSRGCPWRCGYCYNQAVNRRIFRAQSPDKVLDEVGKLRALGVSSLIFEDDNFFADRNRATAIIRRVGLPWSCSIRADYIAKWGKEFVREISEHGCFELRIGAESGSQRILDLMHKDVTVDEVRRAVSLLAEFRIQTVLNFMVGIPGETWDDTRRTMDLIDDLEGLSPYVVVSSLALFALWPGSPLSELAASMGFKPPASLEGWSRLWAQRMPLAPYMDKRIKFIGFYRTLIRRDFKNLPFPFLARVLKRMAQARWRARFFRLPLDYYLPATFLRLLRRIGLRQVAGAIFD
jgi:anaerobic magnesium-protoporphyrin IX monomethyl ester cyclase